MGLPPGPPKGLPGKGPLPSMPWWLFCGESGEREGVLGCAPAPAPAPPPPPPGTKGLAPTLRLADPAAVAVAIGGLQGPRGAAAAGAFAGSREEGSFGGGEPGRPDASTFGEGPFPPALPHCICICMCWWCMCMWCMCCCCICIWY
jgi:hypothetical protein